MHMYCLFCQTQKSEQIAELLDLILNEGAEAGKADVTGNGGSAGKAGASRDVDSAGSTGVAGDGGAVGSAATAENGWPAGSTATAENGWPAGSTGTSTCTGIPTRTGTVRCISPKIVQRCWVQGREEQRTHKYLPGYLFLYAEEPITDFLQVRRINGVVRILGLREDGYELQGADRDFARMLARLDGTIGIMKAIQVGDRVHLDHRAYEGFAGEVVRLDRRKGRCQIRFEFDGSTQNVWVGYELVKTEEPEAPEEAEKKQEEQQ